MWDSDKGEQDGKKENTSRCDRSCFDGVDHCGRSRCQIIWEIFLFQGNNGSVPVLRNRKRRSGSDHSGRCGGRGKGCQYRRQWLSAFVFCTGAVKQQILLWHEWKTAALYNSTGSVWDPAWFDNLYGFGRSCGAYVSDLCVAGWSAICIPQLYGELL